jgi:hypothetical protein
VCESAQLRSRFSDSALGNRRWFSDSCSALGRRGIGARARSRVSVGSALGAFGQLGLPAGLKWRKGRARRDGRNFGSRSSVSELESACVRVCLSAPVTALAPWEGHGRQAKPAEGDFDAATTSILP